LTGLTLASTTYGCTSGPYTPAPRLS
jgi:hypothetical protein